MEKSKFILSTVLLAAVVGCLSLSQPAHAADDGAFDVDPKFRAKIAKEKVKQAISKNQSAQVGSGQASPDCGSMNIGNVDTGGRIGTAPREVFVFAPNAINLVSSQGCK